MSTRTPLESEQRFFFLHVMKTAGGTLRQQIFANFERDQVYPWGRLDSDMLKANCNLEYLANLPVSRRARIRVFTGHFPFVAVDLLGGDLTTITVLRDPVERTISFLRQRKRNNPVHKAHRLEQMYEHPFLFRCFIENHQAKLFALTSQDNPKSYMDVLDVDARRLEIAKRNLECVDVVGIQDRFDELLSELEQRFGWSRAAVLSSNVDPGTSPEVPATFRRRIAEDNAADMEFFEHARRVCEQRRRSTPKTARSR
ncbi:MAG: hypothetical protein AABM43_07130 [Actinomycetota bacterium]